jgi:hypothetical protein
MDPMADFKYDGCFPPNHRTVATPEVSQRPATPKTGLWARLVLWFKDQPIPSAPVRPVYRQYQAQGDQDPRSK